MIISLFFLLSSFCYPQSPIQRFAVIGDFGTNNKCNTNELAVANLVNSWDPAFVITTGDNIYFGVNNNSQNSCTHEHVNTFDSSITKYYGKFYSRNSLLNRFFPSIGDHDIAGEIDTDPRQGFYLANYKEFFALPGNERYYTFQKGNVRFICLNSDFGGKSTWTGGGVYPDTTVWEPDGIDSNSVQAQWCKSILDTSTARWNVVYLHKPIYYSFIREYMDRYEKVRWPFKSWGADIVLSGDLHWYERVSRDGMTYIANGLGGGKFDPLFEDTIKNFTYAEGSKILYNDTLGAQLVEEYEDSLVFSFINVNNELVDRYVLLQPMTIRVKSFLEGHTLGLTGRMAPDTVSIVLRRSYQPFSAVDSARSLTDSLGNALYTFRNSPLKGYFYIVVTHRNSLETWSKWPVQIEDGFVYDFTTDSLKAYGNNLVRKGSKWCIFSGDVIQDGVIDGSDYIIVANEAASYGNGYAISDLNGDRLVDATDMSIVSNNVFRYVISLRPAFNSPIITTDP